MNDLAEGQIALEREARAARHRLARDLGELLHRRKRFAGRMHWMAPLFLVAIGCGALSVSYLAVRSHARRASLVMRQRPTPLSLVMDGVLLAAAALLMAGHRAAYRSSLPTLPEQRQPEPW